MKNTADDNYDVFMFNLRWLYLNFLNFLYLCSKEYGSSRGNIQTGKPLLLVSLQDITIIVSYLIISRENDLFGLVKIFKQFKTLSQCSLDTLRKRKEACAILLQPHTARLLTIYNQETHFLLLQQNS